MSIQLIEQGFANIAGTQTESMKGFCELDKKGIMYRIKCFGQIMCWNDHRDIILRRTLRNSPHVNTITAKRMEQLTAHARGLFHVFAHYG